MKTSEAFRRAKAVLWNGQGRQTEGKERFICYAICRTTGHKKAKRTIVSRLCYHHTLGGWLEAQGVREWTIKQLQQHRHAWLDLLIAEFEAKGD